MDLPSSSSMNPARKVLDGVTYISETVASVSYEPSRLLSSWVADQFAPKYWKSNAEIKVNCKKKRVKNKYIFLYNMNLTI
jgi:zinc finger FYVE domain-containing protein 1